MVLAFGDGTQKAVNLSRKNLVQDTISHLYGTAAYRIASLRVYADNKSDVKYESVSVSSDPMPVIADSMNGVEGSTAVFAKSKIAWSLRGWPVTIHLVSADADLATTESSE